MGISPFHFVGSITETKQDLMITEDDVKDYAAFAVNRGLANNLDCILYASEMNRLSNLPSRMQYDFLRHAITKKKRYGKWIKETEVDKKVEAQLDLIQSYYKVNRDIAEAYFNLLEPEQLERIKTLMGGDSFKKVSK